MKENKVRVIKINPRIYPLRVVYSCAYVFLDKAYIMLDGDPKRQLLVSIKAKNGTDPGKLAGEFINELLNASLRYEISRENKKIREFIVGSALVSVSETKAVKNEAADKNKHVAMNWGHVKNIRNYGRSSAKDKKIADPQGIAIPWEEKYGKCHRDKIQ